MLKFLILLLVLLAAYGLVVVLLRRLSETSQQLGALRDQMARNDARLSEQMREMDARQAQSSSNEPPAGA